MTRRARPSGGFTLLEVLVAIAILGLGLTVILSSQVGLFSSSQRSANLSLATNLARCRMGEVEVKMMKDGFPLTDEKDEGPCCEDESTKDMRCAWKIERIELPPPPTLDAIGDGGLALSGEGGAPLGGGASMGGAPMGAMPPPGSGMGPLGALASVQQSGGAVLGDGGIGSLSNLMSAASSGTQGMAPLLMSMVYPSLKPMLEESIRKITVTVKWREGRNDRTLEIQQYLTNPLQGGFDPNAAAGVNAIGGLMESQGGGLPSGGGLPQMGGTR